MEDYVQEGTKIYEYRMKKNSDIYSINCKCNKCGECFWKGISRNPDIYEAQKCARCIRDTQSFKNIVKTIKPGCVVNLEVECSRDCFWWDWFHQKRTFHNYDIRYVKKSSDKVNKQSIQDKRINPSKSNSKSKKKLNIIGSMNDVNQV